MHLNPDDIAIAEACGVIFIQASPAQVQRLAMQRKVFYASGQPLLATRGDGFYETAGTLQRLLEAGQQELRDMAAWKGGAEPAPTTDEGVSKVDPGAFEGNPAATTEAGTAPPAAVSMEPKPSRRRRRAKDATPSAEPAAGRMAQEPLSPLPPADLTDLALPGKAPARGSKWLVAGAERRGRAMKHWSTRQR